MSSLLKNNNVLVPISEIQSHYNTRYKYFGTTCKIACFSKAIFNPHGFELHGKLSRISYVQGERNEVRSDSVKRARDKCFEIAYANKFSYFITLTLNKEKVCREDLPSIYKTLRGWLSNNVQRRGMSYILCPEFHEDGHAVHFHGLCSGLLPLVDSGTVAVSGYKKPMKKGKALRLGLQGKTVYNLENWGLGFSTVVELDGNIEGIANYIIKYITKAQGMIFGRNYFSGGKLERTVPTVYENYPYCEFDGEERTVLPGVLAVKYRTI